MLLFASCGGAGAASRADATGPVANLWVAPDGSASCVRSATQVSFTQAQTTSSVCDTADHAYHAAAAFGDIIRVKNGTYPGFTLTADPTKTSGTTIIRPETDYGVTLTSPTVFGPNIANVTVMRFTVVSPGGGFTNTSFGFSRNVTLDGNRINIGQKVDGTPAGIGFYTNIDGYRIVNNVIGPTCCGSAHQQSPVGINIGKANRTAPNATHLLIDGNTIQYTLRSCGYWPAQYGACPDATCVSASCHDDAMHLWGLSDSTISNNTIVDAEVQGIFVEDAGSAINTNLTIVNNTISVVGGSAAMNLKGIAGTWNVAFNSTPDGIIAGYGFPVATPGTVVQFAANHGTLLIANPRGNNAGCTSTNANVALVYTQNTWNVGNGGATSTAGCSSTDARPGARRYGGLGSRSTSFAGQNLRSTSVPGVGYYAVDGTLKRRVTSFHLQLNVQPAFTITQRIGLLVRDNLPDDAVTVKSPAGCVVWRSRKLEKLVGLEFAVARAEPGASTARLTAQAKPTC